MRAPGASGLLEGVSRTEPRPSRRPDKLPVRAPEDAPSQHSCARAAGCGEGAAGRREGPARRGARRREERTQAAWSRPPAGSRALRRQRRRGARGLRRGVVTSRWRRPWLAQGPLLQSVNYAGLAPAAEWSEARGRGGAGLRRPSLLAAPRPPRSRPQTARSLAGAPRCPGAARFPFKRRPSVRPPRLPIARCSPSRRQPRGGLGGDRDRLRRPPGARLGPGSPRRGPLAAQGRAGDRGVAGAARRQGGRVQWKYATSCRCCPWTGRSPSTSSAAEEPSASAPAPRSSAARIPGSSRRDVELFPMTVLTRLRYIFVCSAMSV